ncbi:hypothetical protein D9M68_18880 [compost metagenome]
MTTKATMKTVLDRAIGELREGFVDAKTVADILIQYQSLGHMDLRSSERVYPITIGHKPDTDYIMVDGRKVNACLRMSKLGESQAYVWLNSGMLVSIDHVHNHFEFQPRYTVAIDVDDGSYFHRSLRNGESLWVTEAMFDKAFYPFKFEEKDGRKWRIPMNSLKEALEN